LTRSFRPHYDLGLT